MWGAAAAAYQIEGAASVGGRKPSVWDDYCDRPDAVKQGHSGAVACDHYHRFEEDIALMGEIGLQAYRLSLAWPRILPDGTGAVNEEGLAFYDRLIDTLLANNMETNCSQNVGFHFPMSLRRCSPADARLKGMAVPQRSCTQMGRRRWPPPRGSSMELAILASKLSDRAHFYQS